MTQSPQKPYLALDISKTIALEVHMTPSSWNYKVNEKLLGSQNFFGGPPKKTLNSRIFFENVLYLPEGYLENLVYHFYGTINFKFETCKSIEG